MTDPTGTTMTDATAEFSPAEEAFRDSLFDLADLFVDSQQTTAAVTELYSAERADHGATLRRLGDAENEVERLRGCQKRQAETIREGWDVLKAANADLEATKAVYLETLGKNEQLADIADEILAGHDELARMLDAVEAINEQLATSVVDLRADLALSEMARKALNAQSDEQEREIDFLNRCLDAANREITMRDWSETTAAW